MNPSIFAIVIGVFYALIYMAFSAVAIVKLVQLGQLSERPSNYGITTAASIGTLIYSLAMSIVSVLMIVGVRKRRSALIVPWVILAAIGIIGTILYVCIAGYKLDTWELFSNISFIATQTMTWYAVYSLWREVLADDSKLKPNQEQVQ